MQQLIPRSYPGKIVSHHEFLEPCTSGDLSAVKAALDSNTPDTQIIVSMVTIAAYYKHLKLVEYLTERFPEVDISRRPILAACKTGSKDIVSLFVKKHPSILTVPHFNGTPLTAAIEAGTTLDFLEFLIELGADPNGKATGTTSVLSTAARRTRSVGPSCIEVISLLLQKGARLEKSGVLSSAVQGVSAQKEKVKFLLEQGADPNTDVDGSRAPAPPLHRAVAQGDLELVNMLLEHGADPNMKIWDGRTAFDFNAKSQQDIEDALKVAAGRYDIAIHSNYVQLSKVDLNRNNSSN